MSRRTKVLLALGATVAVVGFLLFRPDTLFRDDVVEESLDEAFADAPAPSATTGAGPTSSNPADETVEAGTDTTSFAPASQATVEVGNDTTSSAPAARATVEPSSTTTTSSAPTTTNPDPVAIAGGSFLGIDHSASGTATVYERSGEFVLRFEDDTDIQNGPDLYVWLIEDESYRSGDPGNFVDLGRLKGNVGGQNYELPSEYDPDVHRAVLIWCLRFDVPFALAPITS